MTPCSTASSRPNSTLFTALVLYVLTFALFGFPWLRQIGETIPTYPNRFDAQLIVWVLSWVTHALVDPTARVFDANIYHPAPAQLTGSEHLFSLQVLFAPVYLLTDQPVLATGVVTFLTYPIGALAMAALLLRLGCSPPVAWLSGLAYAVGILRIPLNFHTLQYPNLFLPLVALGAIRAHGSGRMKDGVWLFLILIAALLTSYYIAAIACVTLGLWALAEIIISRRGMVGFALKIGLALTVASGLAGLLLNPYIARSANMVPGKLPWDHADSLWAHTLVAAGYWQTQAEVWRVPFAFLALLGLAHRDDAAWRRMAVCGGLVCILGTALVVFGLPGWLGQLAAHTPLRNFRGWVRLLLVTDFGLCILAAAGLDFCWRRFGVRMAIVPVVAFFLLTTLPRLIHLTSGLAPLPEALGDRADAYRTVKRYTDELGRGPLLELPAGIAIDCEAMLGSTFHWLPLLNGFTGYGPPHTRAMRAASSALPDQAALQDLVDLAHVRWILMRPKEDWLRPRLREQVRQGLDGSPLIGRSFSFDGFTLLEVTAPPLRPGWYPAAAAHPKPGATALGTPIRTLVPAESVAILEVVDQPGTLPSLNTIKLRIRNAGTADWPVLFGGPSLQFAGLGMAQAPPPLSVYLEARWTELAAAPNQGMKREVVQNTLLDRDVLVGESIVQSVPVPKLPSSGPYQLDLRVVQRDGPGFTEPPSGMLHEVLDLRPGANPAPATAGGRQRLLAE